MTDADKRTVMPMGKLFIDKLMGCRPKMPENIDKQIEEIEGRLDESMRNLGIRENHYCSDVSILLGHVDTLRAEAKAARRKALKNVSEPKGE